MNRANDSISRIIGLVICAALAANNAILVLQNGPKHLPWMRSLNAEMATNLSGIFIHNPADRPRATIWFMAVIFVYAGFVVAATFWIRTNPSIRRSAFADALLLSLQIAIGLIVDLNFLIFIALELALFLPLNSAVKWLIGMMLAEIFSAIWFGFNSGDVIVNIIVAGRILVWMGFTFGIGYVVMAITRSRFTLAAAHAELAATQQLLSDTIRTSERVRIARDLHDAIGHQLTAMNLHLELAMRQAEGRVVASVATSRELTQRLLSEMRLLVSVERQAQTVNFRKSLEILCAGVQSPHVILSFSDEIEICDPALAHTVFCCVQEAIANAVQHASATELKIFFSSGRNGLAISIADNGRAGCEIKEGRGIRDMRERIVEFGGQLHVHRCAETSFNLDIWLPTGKGMQ